MKRKNITIPAPIADYGENVMVHNYRSDKDEEGVITHLEYRNAFGNNNWSWCYTVKTIRKAKSGYGVNLYVGDDSIRGLQ